MVSYDRVVAAEVPRAARAVRVPMRDGIELAADLYLPPADPSPGPTVLIRTPYDKSGAIAPTPLLAEYLVDRGYRVVVQDVRGKFRSGGETLLFVNEARDGHDTLDWIVAQDWSDGSVGMAGNSYYGFAQWAAASTNHPALRAIAPRLTGTRLGEHPTSDDGGATRDAMMQAILVYPLTMFAAQDTWFWEPDWSSRPYSDQAEAFFASAGVRAASYDLWVPHPVRLRRFPDGHPFDARPIPVLHTIGWWDNCAPWAWSDHEELSARPEWAEHVHLLIEPIDHYSFELNSDDRVAIASPDEVRARLPRLLGPTADFLDVHLRGSGATIPKVRWSLAQTDEVREAPHWPPPGIEVRTFHARADGAVGTEPGEAAMVSWVHDPDDPVPSSAPDPFRYLLTSPDEAPLAERDDVLAFCSEPLEEAVDLVGPVTARGRFGSDGPSLDVHIRLLDIDGSGRATRIARGAIHIAHGDGAAMVAIRMGHVGYRVHAGHRVSIQVASSDAPEFLAQPGTGEDPWTATHTRTNVNSVVLGGLHGLRIDVGAG